MARYLVAFSPHPSNHSRVGRVRIINLSLPIVVRGDEKRRLRTIRLEKIEDIGSVDVWAIVVGYGNGTRLGALIDAGTTVQDTAQRWARDRGGVGSRRGLVGVTTGTII